MLMPAGKWLAVIALALAATAAASPSKGKRRSVCRTMC
jgi:hypothetical protein